MSTSTRLPQIRKKYFSYPRFQWMLISVNSLLSTLTYLCSCFFLLYGFSALRKSASDAMLPNSHPFFQILDMQSKALLINLTIGFIISFFVSNIVILLLSHKLTGPIIRLKSYFRALADGKAQKPISFRKNDYFDDLPPLINEAISKLKTEK